MSRSHSDLPERLLDGGATEFERRILEAGTRKGPPPEVLATMARTLGVSAATVGIAATAKTLASNAVAAKATAGTGTGTATLLPWLTVGALALVAAGIVFGTRAWKPSTSTSGPAPAAATPPSLGGLAPSAAGTAAPVNNDAVPGLHDRPTASASDLRDQIAMIDLVRSALSAGDDRRALENARLYRDRYPAGQFLPEATALKIEALVRLNRVAEARALAERFVVENQGTLLAERVAALAGLSRP